MDRPAIWLISGAPGAGKSAVAEALCRSFTRAVHIPVDDIRGWVRSGSASPVNWTPEAGRQFVLARRGAARMAADYADAGFLVVLDDVVRESQIHQYTDHVGTATLGKVLLSPTLETVLARNAAPGRKDFDTSDLETECRSLHPLLLAENTPAQGWIVVDSTTLDVGQTVQAILRAA